MIHAQRMRVILRFTLISPTARATGHDTPEMDVLQTRNSPLAWPKSGRELRATTTHQDGNISDK